MTPASAVRLVSVRFSGVEDGPAQLEMFAEADGSAAARQCARPPEPTACHATVVRRGHQLGPPPD